MVLMGPVPAPLFATPAPWIKLSYAALLALATGWMAARLGRPVSRLGGPVLATLDLHGNIVRRMVDNADVLVAYRSNPHVDMFERGADCAGALEEIGLLMRDMVLFRKGYRYPGTNPDDFARSTNIELERRIGALLKSGTPSDADMDGEIDDDEVEGYGLSLLVR
jgi:hypothetical protein